MNDSAISTNGILKGIVSDGPWRAQNDASSRSAPDAGRRRRGTGSTMRNWSNPRAHCALTAFVWRSRGARSAPESSLVPGMPRNWSCPSQTRWMRLTGAAVVPRSQRAMRSGPDLPRAISSAMREFLAPTRENPIATAVLTATRSVRSQIQLGTERAWVEVLSSPECVRRATP